MSCCWGTWISISISMHFSFLQNRVSYSQQKSLLFRLNFEVISQLISLINRDKIDDCCAFFVVSMFNTFEYILRGNVLMNSNDHQVPLYINSILPINMERIYNYFPKRLSILTNKHCFLLLIRVVSRRISFY